MITDSGDGAVVHIRVIPRADKTALAGRREGAILVRLAAPPVAGAANAELIALLSRELGLAKRHFVLVSGEKSRTKRVKVVGVSAATIAERLYLLPDDR